MTFCILNQLKVVYTAPGYDSDGAIARDQLLLSDDNTGFFVLSWSRSQGLVAAVWQSPDDYTFPGNDCGSTIARDQLLPSGNNQGYVHIPWL